MSAGTYRRIEEYGEDIEDFDEDELHNFIIPEGCHWDDVRTVSENVGLAIVNAMVGIERANPDTLGGLFSSFDDANWTDPVPGPCLRHTMRRERTNCGRGCSFSFLVTLTL